jgi:hypothetical protein
MPACRQCGKQNPEGTVFCGYCATSLAPAKPVTPPSSNPDPPASAQDIRQQAPPNVFKAPEAKAPPPHILRAAPPPPVDRGKGGFELLPWSELSANQKAGRIIAGLVVLLVVFYLLRGLLRGGGSNQAASQPQGEQSALTDSDRRDGIEALCKVFQIYKLPRNDQEAAAATKNAATLAGNQSPERSTLILTTIVGEFRSGKLKETDCAEAGYPLPTSGYTEAPADGGDNLGGIPTIPPANAAPNSGATR